MMAAAVAILLVAFNAFAQTDSPGRTGLWSRSATWIWAVDKPLTIASPDGKKSVFVQPIHNPDSDATTIVTVRANDRSYKTQMGSWVNAELAWSPDSKAFFVTYSDGGNVGTYHVKVVYVDDTGLRMTEPVANGRRLFVPTCFDPERPNVASIEWLGHESSRLLIAVQVPPHSSCASMGTFRAFEIGLPDGNVVSRYGQIAAKKLFGSAMGNELRDADDACVQKPQTCIPSGLTSRKPEAER
jgi:hypothetical protein